MIQLGAILAVVVHYRRLLSARVAGLLRRDVASVRLATALAVAFAPAAAIGFLLHKTIKAHLFGPLPVAFALFAGGVLMIVVERVRAKRELHGLVGLNTLYSGARARDWPRAVLFTLARLFAFDGGDCCGASDGPVHRDGG